MFWHLISSTLESNQESNNTFKRHFFNTLGFLCIGLAAVGIILPVMPTTIFVILAAYFFAKGSKKFHDWLLRNKVFGTYLSNYRDGKGMSVGSKIFSISFLWVGIIFSVVMLEITWLKIALLAVAIAVTIHIYKIKTTPKVG
ncbi:MAG: YbaN family protein [Ignavibacteria bacterium]|nr:YbaN family protein [Ignavibacteria bacterium]MBK9227601.1 YbaN family protein [Ignavibacteria bacterium]